VWEVIAGLDPAIHHLEMDHRVSALRAGPVMTLVGNLVAMGTW
jgi:hypothetical protein